MKAILDAALKNNNSAQNVAFGMGKKNEDQHPTVPYLIPLDNLLLLMVKLN